MASAVELVVQCPSCLEPNQRSELASLGSWYLRLWTDGWRDPFPPDGAVFRCGACQAVAFREAFQDLGPLLHPEVLCDVELLASGRERIRVMHALRAAIGMDLPGVKRLVDAAPVMVATDLWAREAESLASALRDLGAGCALHRKERGPSSPASWLDAPHLSVVRDVETLRGQVEVSGLALVHERALRLELYWAGNHPFREGGRPWIPVPGRGPEERENAGRLFALMSEDDPVDSLLKANLARESADFAAAQRLLAKGLFGDQEPWARFLWRLIDSQETAVLPIVQGEPEATQPGDGPDGDPCFAPLGSTLGR